MVGTEMLESGDGGAIKKKLSTEVSVMQWIIQHRTYNPPKPRRPRGKKRKRQAEAGQHPPQPAESGSCDGSSSV